MSTKRVSISLRPTPDQSAENWVKHRPESHSSAAPAKAELYTARLTIDVTPQLRARIKMSAFKRGRTVVELLRELLEREYPNEEGSSP